MAVSSAALPPIRRAQAPNRNNRQFPNAAPSIELMVGPFGFKIVARGEHEDNHHARAIHFIPCSALSERKTAG